MALRHQNSFQHSTKMGGREYARGPDARVDHRPTSLLNRADEVID